MDLNTIFITELVFMFITVVFLSMLNVKNNSFLGIKEWQKGYSLFFIGVVMFLLRGSAPIFITISVANSITMFAYFLIYYGFCKNRKSKINLKLHTFIQIVYFVLMFYFTYSNNQIFIRIIMTYTLIGFYYILMCISISKFKNLFKYVALIIYFLNVIMSMINVLYYILSKSNTPLFSIKLIIPLTIFFHLITIPTNVVIISLVITYETLEKLDKLLVKEKENNKKIMQLLFEKEEFLQSISHDLRTPLNGIIGMSELGIISKDIAKKQNYLQVIYTSSKHLLYLINQILFDDKEGLKVRFDIKNIIKDEIKTFEKILLRKGLYFYYYIGKDIPKFFGEKDMIKQALLNIIDNAIKYTSLGGVFIRVSSLDTNIDSSKIKIEIKDSGRGISEKNIDRIFEKSYREESDSEGKGLGLYNSKKIIEDLKGSIDVESEKGKSTLFTIELELETLEMKETKKKVKKKVDIVIVAVEMLMKEFVISVLSDYEFEYFILESVEELFDLESEIEKNYKIILPVSEYSKFKNKEVYKERIFIIDEGIKYLELLDFIGIEGSKINEKDYGNSIKIPSFKNVRSLIIEDDYVNIKFLTDIFERMEVKYEVAKSIKETKELLENNIFDIIISDYLLGEEAALEFFKYNNIEKSVKVAVTASVNEKIKKEFYDIGFNEYITKPYNIGTIIEIMKKYFEYSENSKAKDSEYLRLFIEQFNIEIKNIDRNIEVNEFENVRKIFHKIKGGAYIIKESHIAKIIENCERDLRKNELDKIESRITELKNELVKLEERYNENSNS